MDEDSHSYYLIKQSETILTQLREQAKKIESAEQKISTNLKSIRSGHNQLKPLTQHSMNFIQNPPQSGYNLGESVQNISMKSNNTSQSKENRSFYKLSQEMDDIQQYSEQYNSSPSKTQQISLSNNLQFPTKYSNNIEISFANNSYQHESYIPTCQIVFVPFNKLYRSPILQLKDKQRLILARKYKGSNMKISDGKISDGKVFKFERIVTDEDELLDLLSNCSSIGLIGSFGTLKKKIHMCLFIKFYQRLVNTVSSDNSYQSTFHVQYIELVNRSAVVHIYQIFKFNNASRRSQASRMTHVFQDILSQMIDKQHKINQKQKAKNRTRVIRIIQQQTSEKYQVVSSTNQNLQIFKQFQFKKVVWCINPLVKHYEMTQNTLEFAKKVEQQSRVG